MGNHAYGAGLTTKPLCWRTTLVRGSTALEKDSASRATTLPLRISARHVIRTSMSTKTGIRWSAVKSFWRGAY